MEQINIFLNNFKIEEVMPYLSIETFLIIGIIFNLFLMLIFKRHKARRFSDYITSIIFASNVLISSFMYIYNKFTINPNFEFIKAPSLCINEFSIYKILINLIFLFFIFNFHKFVRRTSAKPPILNILLLIIALFSCISIQVKSYIISFLLLDVTVYFIYKFSSCLRYRKTELYSKNFIFLSGSLSILFYILYGFTYLFNDNLQLLVINSTMLVVYLSKIGIFPIYNYLVLKNNHKHNIMYSYLLYVFFPYIGIMNFDKLLYSITSYEIDATVLATSFFILLAMISFVIMGLNTKNILKFFSYYSLSIFAFCALGTLYTIDISTINKLASLYILILTAIYSFISIIKLNLNIKKINFSTFKNLFIKNRYYCALFTFAILVLFLIFPTKITSYTLITIKNIYIYDSYMIILVTLIATIGIIFFSKSIKIIQNCYTYRKDETTVKLNKITTLNYVVILSVFILIIFFTIL